jgi:hypothetical protein
VLDRGHAELLRTPFPRTPEMPLRAGPDGLGPPARRDPIARYYAPAQEANPGRSWAFGVGQRLSLENNPMNESQSEWPRQVRWEKLGAAREKMREGHRGLNPLRSFSCIDLSSKRGVTHPKVLGAGQSAGCAGMREGRGQRVRAGEGVGRSFRNPLQRTLGTGSFAAYAPHRGSS